MSAPFKIGRGLPLHHQVSPEAIDAKARAVSKMYEEYFLQQMVKAMRKTVVPADKPSFADNLYRQQLDEQYVDLWGARGGVGLANIIYNQLKERFLNSGAPPPNVHGPIPLNKNIRIKIEKPKQAARDLTFLYEWNENSSLPDVKSREITAPFDSQVLQAFRSPDERQTIKLAHDNGLVSTLSFIGLGQDLRPGEKILAGEKLGTLSPSARGLTWQLSS